MEQKNCKEGLLRLIFKVVKDNSDEPVKNEYLTQVVQIPANDTIFGLRNLPEVVGGEWIKKDSIFKGCSPEYVSAGQTV